MEIVGCEPNENCKYAPDCFADVHHAYHPANAYKTSLEKEFRQDPRNKSLLCRARHDEEHQLPPPIKPTRDQMLQFLGGLGIKR